MTLEERLEKQWKQMKGSDQPVIIDLDQEDQDSLPVLDVVPSFAITLSDAKERVQLLQTFVADMMIPGIDYGYVPGCQKPSLFKPGAEKLCDIFGFTKQIQIVDRMIDWEIGVFAYEVKAILTSKRTGMVEAEGIGSCNSREMKYRQQDGFSVSNTILKMAKKRALVDAVLSATRSSALFTQDLEDIDLPDNHEEDRRLQSQQTKSKSEANNKSEKGNRATDKQLAKIYFMVKEMDMPNETASQLIRDRYNKSNSKELDIRQASDFIKYLLVLKG